MRDDLVAPSALHDYGIAGVRLAATRPLPELHTVRSAAGKPDITIRFERGRPQPRRGGAVVLSIATADDGHSPWLVASKVGEGYQLAFPGLARFETDAAATRVMVYPSARIPRRTVHHLLLDQVLPLLLQRRGCHVLHASVVLTARGAVGFIGPSGAGKSTVAAALARSGHHVLADDCAVLTRHAGRIHVEGLYPGLRLWDDAAAAIGARPAGRVSHYSAKRRAYAPRPACGPRPLLALYRLHREPRWGSEAPWRVSALPPNAQFVETVRALFRFDARHRALLEKEFRFIGDLLAGIRVAALHIPDDLGVLLQIARRLGPELLTGAS